MALGDASQYQPSLAGRLLLFLLTVGGAALFTSTHRFYGREADPAYFVGLTCCWKCGPDAMSPVVYLAFFVALTCTCFPRASSWRSITAAVGLLISC